MMGKGRLVLVSIFLLLVVGASYLLIVNKARGWPSREQPPEGAGSLWPWLGSVRRENTTVGDSNARRCSASDKDLRIDKLDDALKQNKTLLKLIRDNCYWVFGGRPLDVTGDGVDETVIIAMNAWCASCHSNVAYIFSGERVLFQKVGMGVIVEKPWFPVTGFTFSETLPRYDEYACCPSERLAYTYKYSPVEERGAEDNVLASYSVMPSFGSVEPSDSPFFLYDVRSWDISGEDKK